MCKIVLIFSLESKEVQGNARLLRLKLRESEHLVDKVG